MAEQQHPKEGFKNMLPDKGGPSTPKIVAVVTLFPIGGILLTLSGITLTGTVIGLAVSTPVFVLFSPVLVPAAFVLMLAMTGFLASGAIGLIALSALSWMVHYARRAWPLAKHRIRDVAGQVGQRTKEVSK
ncbi:oleosin Cor a 15-like [Magnolia sinica]|uniref:oleosin Cor a 15-like n=1 Tax=Magnolia sinica TaxID=86752 RepID=UPI002657C007|nr:oleosin Cor a 15-like [Magnolia sinica]